MSSDDGATAAGRSRAIRVAVVEPHAAMRLSLRQLLEAEPDLEVVAEASEPVAIVRQLATCKPDVIVLDLGLSSGGSLVVIRRLSQIEASAAAIIAITLHEDPAFVREAIRAGASEVVRKETADAELPQAIRAAVR